MNVLRMRLTAILLFGSIILLSCDGFEQATPLPTSVVPLPTSASIPNPPTPALPSPTPLPTSAPLPTATYDATLDDWTILVYMDADNNLELPGLLDLNEMEAAGSSEQVNVIVQIDRALGESTLDGDWSDTRRYRILGDGDRNLLNSEPLQSLGEQNMGDPQVLADFISWGIQSFPANRYALILWDHGAGWSGIAYDGDAPHFGWRRSHQPARFAGRVADGSGRGGSARAGCHRLRRLPDGAAGRVPGGTAVYPLRRRFRRAHPRPGLGLRSAAAHPLRQSRRRRPFPGQQHGQRIPQLLYGRTAR
jgi:hypothetical protein